MNILAIDSSGLTASVAIMKDGKLAAEYTVNNKKTHSQTLLPMIDEIMKAEDMEPAQLDCIAISRGPGSFTGLRIGSATAKGLGLALDIPVAEVSSLDALAYNLYGNEGCIICPIMDARRQEVYTAAYEFVPVSEGEQAGSYEMKKIIEEKACPLTELLEELGKTGKKVLFNGDGVPVNKENICEYLKDKAAFAPESLLLQKASSVAAIGALLYQNGGTVSADAHVPVYLRKSQAEREREADNVQ